MSGFAFLLVIVAAFAHAGWNLLAKRAGTAGVEFVWIYTGAEVLLYAPVVALALLYSSNHFGVIELGFIAGSGLLHAAYFVLLQRAYATGDLSLVYPVARGLGPLIAVIGAIVILRESPALLAVGGALAICSGVFWLGSVGHRRRVAVRQPGTSPMVYAVATGAAIGAYTLWDGHAMGSLVLSPIVFQWGSNLGRFALLTPAMIGRFGTVPTTWRRYRREVVGVAALAPLAYMLALWAFTMAPVAYVAPAREISIVIGTLFGSFLLDEEHRWRRLSASGAIVFGAVLIGLA